MFAATRFCGVGFCHQLTSLLTAAMLSVMKNMCHTFFVHSLSSLVHLTFDDHYQYVLKLLMVFSSIACIFAAYPFLKSGHTQGNIETVGAWWKQ